MKFLLTILTTVLTINLAIAQQGTLKGKVTDKATGEAVIGAVVFIKGTAKGSSTDYEGNYSLALEPGIHTISATFLSYKPSENPGVTIKSGQPTTLNIQLEDNSTELNVVEVVATRQTNTELSLIQDLRQSEVVVSGVSGEQIAKSLDRDAAAVVKRIPGVTVMNDKYIMIRGLSERYNTVMLNDALAPSTEPDSRAFSFDILPTSVLDRILVFKSGSPELPGEFGGGVIKVYTKNFATENTTSFGITGGYRSGTTFRTINTQHGSKTDFLGFDNNTRALPGSFPSHLNNVGSESLISAARQLRNGWAFNSKTAAPDLRLSLGLTRRFFIGNTEASSLTALSYSNTTQLQHVNRYRYTYNEAEQKTNLIEYSYNDTESSQNARVGLISNWAFRLNNSNKIEFRNLFNQMGQSQVIARTGQEVQGKSVDVQNFSQHYESRTVYSGQLQGTHDAADDRTTYTWTAGYNYSNRNEPNYKRIRSQRNIGSNEPFRWVIPQNSATTFDAGRFDSGMQENTVLAAGQVERRFAGKDSVSENQPKLRAGFYAENKNRNFDARWMSYIISDPGQFNKNLLTSPLGQLFTSENISTSGFSLAEGTNPTDKYDASSLLVAGYIGGTFTVNDQLNLSGGLRVEFNEQQLSTSKYGGGKTEISNPITNILPSLNATYNFTDRSLLRGGYSMSVNRLEFRELAPFTYYDFQLNAEIRGNENLKTATIHNTDLRFEFYPNPTEILSVGVFYKYFKNPIEIYSIPASGNPIYQPKNASNAQSYGIETEVRKSFLNLSNRSLIQNMSLVLNASLIESKVDLGAESEGQERNRAMYGQSPFIVNAGLYFNDEERALQVNMLYNVIGKRIFTVGDDQAPTVYEMPRNVLDLSVTKGIGKHLELKAGIQDLLNQKVKLMQDSNRDTKITSQDDDFANYKRGSYTTLGINYKF
ncbi:carboxypeptidase-like regulatory domain-containing protein [Pontibacter sp. BT310]|uniref:TonB-dependent receptor n=1 Tax=Pontibacter populi TaxID=890055 RepID=A0ABS6XAI7_9BACT|nr:MULTISPECIES: TonB-dependent receptor [Pontibacter]MBJ6117337.1 carboxypeptidase-like regulatory domain-containing protein [Pontibacter sp. BT310]MBR0569762.1 carboxypeptidase-like regulatory domain-containing protein [Microvirga sp. STS03]MBW3364190.1 TonB-dependent receptor [Pontibacter populi]